MVTGCQPPDVVGADLYRRLASDLRRYDEHTVFCR
jgi:hypothetical protein